MNSLKKESSILFEQSDIAEITLLCDVQFVKRIRKRKDRFQHILMYGKC